MAPTYVVVPVLAVTVTGAIFSTAVILALIVHHLFGGVLLIPIAVGFVGGVLGWMVAIPLGAQRTAAAGALGLSLALSTYIVHLHVVYRLQVSGLEAPPSWWAHLQEQADAGLTLARRRSGDGIPLGSSAYWVVEVIELALAAIVGTVVGGRLQVDQPTTRRASSRG